MAKSKTTRERAIYKQNISSALFESDDIKELLIGDISEVSASEIRNEFKKYVKSHLFIDETITETKSFIFYDIDIPELHTNIKDCHIYMYLIVHRDILDDYSSEKYPGNRADALSQMVEDVLINDKEVANSFGIGELTLDSVGIYNTTSFYGTILQFTTPTFR